MMPIDQLAIMLTGVSAAWILNGPEGRARRYACLIGLAGQPFWFWSTWSHGQWGMFIVTAGFTLAYLRGVWLTWIRPRIGEMGIFFNRSALWIGAHYSPANRRWCINVVPCTTFWLTLPSGNVPERAKL
ncbi:MAG: hypothetical protein KAY21_10940 [Limnohabitans sp.]|nr:hypothetical protein [Limnohabitans sp.]